MARLEPARCERSPGRRGRGVDHSHPYRPSTRLRRSTTIGGWPVERRQARFPSWWCSCPNRGGLGYAPASSIAGPILDSTNESSSSCERHTSQIRRPLSVTAQTWEINPSGASADAVNADCLVDLVVLLACRSRDFEHHHDCHSASLAIVAERVARPSGLVALCLFFHPLQACVVVGELVQVCERDLRGEWGSSSLTLVNGSWSPCSSSTFIPMRNWSTSNGDVAQSIPICSPTGERRRP